MNMNVLKEDVNVLAHICTQENQFWCIQDWHKANWHKPFLAEMTIYSLFWLMILARVHVCASVRAFVYVNVYVANEKYTCLCVTFCHNFAPNTSTYGGIVVTHMFFVWCVVWDTSNQIRSLCDHVWMKWICVCVRARKKPIINSNPV